MRIGTAHICATMLISVKGCLFLVALCCATLTCVSGVDDDDIKHVHLIFMNHLDVGYSLQMLPGYVVDVINAYFTEYFPRAIDVSLQLMAFGFRERFIYTTHPWLVSLYLDCPPNVWLSGRHLHCPDAKNVSDFTAAIKRGSITWHAGPMNMEFEMLDSSMMEFAIQLSIDLDKRFGFDRKHRTVSQRDVPGTTLAIIPILEKMGIDGISIGVNGATVPSDVPTVFKWVYQNSSLITLFHPGGYPNGYGPLPFIPKGLSRKDCAVVPGLDHALCFAFRSDNQGPPMNYTEVLVVYEIARGQFPNADVKASKFEDFMALLKPLEGELPVVTQELGDVWIQGGGSDPRKTAELRAMYRARAECLRIGKCSMSDARVYNASRFMLKLSEHTWGLAGNCVDNLNWDNDAFYKVLNIPGGRYENASNSWEEQRNFTTLALEALGDHYLAGEITRAFTEIDATYPDLTGFHEVAVGSVLEFGLFKLRFDDSGALVQLTDSAGMEWASADNPMARFVYQTYSALDFDKFFNATTPYSKQFFLGIGKPNMSKNASPESKIWQTQLMKLYQNNDKDAILAQIYITSATARTYYGAPREIWLSYRTVEMGMPSGIDVDVQWFNKVPTRMPEGMNFVFMPPKKEGFRWMLNKIDSMIDPLDVATNGSQLLHGVNRGVYYMDKDWKGLQIASLDSAVVNMLTPTSFVTAIPTPHTPLPSVTGVAFNLYNNVWETNYIFWYPYRTKDINQKYRFSLIFG